MIERFKLSKQEFDLFEISGNSLGDLIILVPRFGDYMPHSIGSEAKIRATRQVLHQILVPMKVSFKLKSYPNKEQGAVGKLYVRVRDNGTDSLIKTLLMVVPEYWDGKIPGYKPNTPIEVMSKKGVAEFNKMLKQLIHCIESCASTSTNKADYELVIDTFFKSYDEKEIKTETQTMRAHRLADKANERIKEKEYRPLPTIIDYFERYLSENQFNSWHNQALTSVMHKLERYEAWQGFLAEQEDFHLYLEDFTFEEMERYHEYLSHEYEYRDAYPEFYDQFHLVKSIDIRPLSKNAIHTGITRLEMFLNWCVKQGYLTDLSFRRFRCDGEVYGVPYYLTIEERDYIMDFDLSQYPRLELHRDKFVFQCMIGCRCDDLDHMTWDCIHGDFIEFIPHKNLLNGHAEVVRFPMTDKMRIILERQDPNCATFFFPYCQETYRVDIKDVLRKTGINRKVTILDPQTRKGIQRPICEVAASHLARRTFIANLYNKVKDQSLISSLTGHVDESKAFARYRAISDDTKKSVIGLME